MNLQPLPLLAGIAALLAHSAPAGRVYYNDQPGSGAGTIRSVGLDGSTPGVVKTYAFATSLRGIGWHRASGRIFVLDNTAKVIRSILPNGTGELNVASVDASLLGSDLDVDDVENKIFWAETNTSGVGNGFIRSSNVDGSGFATAVTTLPGSDQSPYFLYLDRVGGFIYWGVNEALGNNNNPTTFRRATFAGAIDPGFGITTQSRSRDIVIDSNTATAYWADRQSGAIWRRPVAGGINEILISGLNAPHGVALDPVARKIYWADTGQRGSGLQPSARRVSRCNLDGPNLEFETLTASDGSNEPWDLTIDLSSPTYADWIARFFQVSSPLRGQLDDADGDGTANLLEYAFDTHPRGPMPGSSAMPQPKAVGSGIQFPRRKVSPLTYRTEVSTNLTIWNYNGDGSGQTWTVDESPTSIDAEMETATVTAGPALAGAAKVFFRVRVLTNEP